jgi:hypothetical protein
MVHEEELMRTNTMLPSLLGSGSEPEPTDPASPELIDRLSRTDDTLKARYGVWIQTSKNHPIGIEEGVYLSTFQEGRGQHITALDTVQARALGSRLIALADEIERETGQISTRGQSNTEST